MYKYLPNKGIRSANSLDVTQDVIKNRHKNKPKTNPILRLRSGQAKAKLKNAQNECKLFYDKLI